MINYFDENKIKSFVNIDGNKCTNQVPVGYCKFYKHKGYLTKEEFKTHECAKKQCKCFVPNYNSVYLQNRETTKLKIKYEKLITKQKLNGYITKNRYEELKQKLKKNDVEFMETYTTSKFIYQLESQTKSNVNSKKIKIPKKPSLWKRLKNRIKLFLRRLFV